MKKYRNFKTYINVTRLYICLKSATSKIQGLNHDFKGYRN